MATERQGRAGIFNGASRRRGAAKPSRSALAPPAGVTYAWDMISDALAWGPDAAGTLGIPPEDLPRTGRAFAHWIEPGIGPSRPEAIASGQGPGGAYDTRYALRFGPDRVIMVQDAGRWQRDAGGRPAFARGYLRLDPASGARDLLPALVRARSDLLIAVQNGINHALAYSQTCTLIVGSLGDGADALEDMGRMLRPMMRRHDHFAALGPNRFALALTCCPASEARSAMRRLAELAKAHPAHAALRLGAACSPDHTFQAAKLLRFAEKGLDRAIAGGEAAGLYAPGHGAEPAPDEASFDWIAALNDRSLTLACRPVADAGSRAPALTQACASLAGPDGSLLPLGPVPSWDGANLALLVDGRMLELAADHLVRRPGERLLLPVSPATLQDPEWLPMLAAHLGARPGIESRLMVEIHEAALAGAATRGRLNAMKALGVAVALSGFGNGYASLAHLGTLPIDCLKIDGVFVQTLKRSTDDRLFVRTLIDRAHHFGIAVAAEWVDDEATARLLASWGVDYLEGACFGELQPASQPSVRPAPKRARA
jgi:EAL domain-containing protein (putative c-di-GMP-specific phosphodiesterase class I)